LTAAIGCTAAELISGLPRSLPGAQLAVDAALGRCVASWLEGLLSLQWSPLPDRCIALLRFPQFQVQVQVHFVFQGLDDAARTHSKNSLTSTPTEEADKPWPFN
jgi:hypothetical protein